MSVQKLSIIQKQFVINAALFDATPAYNIGSYIRIDGNLDEARLQGAWQRVYAAASILHGAVAYQNENPVFSETFSGTAPYSLIDCTEDEVDLLAKQELELPFDLFGQPLVRFVVYRINPSSHFLLIAQHHLVTDLFSKQLLADNLSHAYSDPSFEPIFMPYDRFTEAETAFLESPSGDKALAHWSAKMSAPFETLKLPSAAWTQKTFAAAGSQIPWALQPSLSEEMDEAETTGKAPFLLLLTAYAGLLSRLSGQKRFLVGVPFTNRLSFPDEPLLGPCVNILPILADIGNETTFSELYNHIRAEMLLAHRHQSYPFLEISRLYTQEHDQLRPRLLQAGFTNEPLMNLELPGLACMPRHLSRSGAQMDLFFTWWRQNGRYEGFWEYNGASFGAPEILLAGEYFSAILTAGLNDEHGRIHSVSLAGEREEKRLSGADRTVAYPLEKSMAALLRDSYALHANETALVYRNQTTSYAIFFLGVARIASRISREYGSRGRIVVLLERSPEMLYALHGIVHSGNAYVPLGIDWPDDRIADILADIDPFLILTQEKYLARFASAPCPAATMTDFLAATPDEKENKGGTAPDISPGDAMYILYTSGTTGRPKGAELPHAGIVNRLLWMQDEYRLKAGERCLLKTPYTFDVSGWELFWPFLTGATLVIAEEAQHKDPRELLDLIERHSVRIVHFVPSMLAHFLEQGNLAKADNLRDVVCSGETLPVELLDRFLKTLPQAKLHNLYGPTEASIDVTYWRCSAEDIARGTVPIGYPIANTQIYIVDGAGRQCPPLVKGEILIGGIGLANGYWNRKELTREKFITNPFGEGRLYKTGDWGRYGLDGAIEYLERQDTQTKIRGVRVELGEIETYIRSVEGIENAVVKKGTTPSGQECLIAYYTEQQGKTVDKAAIRAELRHRLSEIIIPEYFMKLNAFPMSENGKLDRKALPGTVAAEKEDSNPLIQSLTPNESKIAELWSLVLGKKSTDIHLNFFDSGGSSLSLLTLRKHLEESFGVPVKVAELFQHPTIGAMAALFLKDGDRPQTDTAMEERARKQKQMMQGYGARGKSK